MTRLLNHVFPTATTVGTGYFCDLIVYQEILTLDYYDGITEGFARLDSSNYIFYFKKSWWDDQQNYRLFEAISINEAVLNDVQSGAYDIIKEYSDTSSKPFISQKPPIEDVLQIKQLFLSNIEKHSFYFVTNDLKANLYAFPLKRDWIE